MKKKITVLALSAVLSALCCSASAQQTGKIYRIGFLSGGFPGPSHWTTTLRTDLRELGYVEGKNIAIESRFAENKPDRLPPMVDELVRLKVDVIVAGGTNDARAARNTTKTIPIVMAGIGIDPVEAGLVESLARPGGNVTGITNLSTELGGKRLELLKEAVPKVTRVAVLYDPAAPGSLRELKETLPVAAGALSLTVRSWEVRDADGFDRVFSALRKERQDGLYVAGGPLMSVNGKRIADFALKGRLPSVYGNKEYVDAGGLMYYGADLADIYRRVAYYVDKILKGAKPTDLPVEQPKKFELVINLKTAKQIGLTIPQSMLFRADKVIK
jgi:putative tryptophan/tyrosine transport system substrate-binding protein